MKIYHHIAEWRATRHALPQDCTLGFIPTMGNLHPGHLSLIQASQQDNHQTVVSLFVNPTQFNQPDDFAHYPRTLDADLALLQKHGVDFCLVPDEHMMYPDGYRYQIQEQQLSQLMEGQHRPGHYTGVLTIVMKLLNLVQPHRAYFGEKDYQQYQLIQEMVSAFFMNIDIRVCPTIREASGLALSSRNNRLTPEEKRLAEQFATLFHQTQSCEHIQNALEQLGIMVDYIEEHAHRRFAAVHIGTVRLIDNYALSDT